MILTIRLSSRKLPDGKFNAEFTFIEWHGPEVTFVPYYLKDDYSSREEAFKYAKGTALNEACKRYSPNTKFDVQIEDEPRSIDGVSSDKDKK